MPGKKRGRGGKPSLADRAPKKIKKARPDKVPLPHDEVNTELEVENADLDFVDEFGGNLGFLESLNAKSLDKQVQKGPAKRQAKQSTQNSGSDSDDQGPEAAYERAPRQRLQEQQSSQAAGLPTKSLHGELVYAKSRPQPASMQVPQVDGITVLDDGALTANTEALDSDASGSGSDSPQDTDSEPEEQAQATGSKPSRPNIKSAAGKGAAAPAQQHDQRDAELQDYQDVQERREEMKQQMGVTASKLLQNPEANLPSMRSLLTLAADKDSQVARLAMLSLLAVFKDILPGYRIRLPTEKELEVPVSKEVKQTRDYESMQVRLYQAYLKLLLRAIGSSKGKPAKSPAEARVAARCMCGMMSTLHHFNYAADLLQAVVPLMVSKDAQLRQLSCDAIKEVLMTDEEGKVAVEAVQLVADLIKRRKCACPPEIVGTLLVLQLKHADIHAASKGKKKGVKTKGKSKKTRRSDEVEKAFQEAEATADRAAARVTQSQMLLALFEIFFRVLKQCTQSGVQAQQAQGFKLTVANAQKRFPLLMPTLAGLTKFAHLISVEYFADLLQVMQQIMQMSALPLQHRLQTLLTASRILKGQGEALNIDRRDMYARLYACIPELALLPLQPDDGTLHSLLSQDGGFDPPPSASQPPLSGTNSPQELPQAVVLLSIAQQMLLDQGKMLDTARLAAFTKKLSCVALHLESGAALGSLSLVNRLLRHNMKLRSLLEHEPGAPPPAWAAAGLTGLTEPETALTGAPLWELALLHKHYHSHLSQAAAAVALIPPQGGGGSGGHSVLASAMEPATLAHTYNTDRGTFKPAPQPPRKAPTAPKNPKLPDFALLPDEEAEAEVAQSLSQHGYSLLEGEQGAQGMVSDEEVGTLLQEWFKEQKHFQENVTLRRQHVLLSRQIALLQKHLAAAGSAAEAPAASATGAVSMKGKLQRRKQIAK